MNNLSLPFLFLLTHNFSGALDNDLVFRLVARLRGNDRVFAPIRTARRRVRRRRIRSRGNDKYSRAWSPRSCSEEFHGAERDGERGERERDRGSEHFVRCDNVRVAQPTCRQWVGMNDLQALKRMNEQPERNVRLDNTPRHTRNCTPPREFMASKRPDASTTLRQIAFERLFNPSLSYTRPISRSNCTLSTDLPRDVFAEGTRLLVCFLENFLYEG